jgi:hypothetical protein
MDISSLTEKEKGLINLNRKLQTRNPKPEIDSTERLDRSLFDKLKALSLSKGSPTGLVADRNKHEGLKSK